MPLRRPHHHDSSTGTPYLRLRFCTLLPRRLIAATRRHALLRDLAHRLDKRPPDRRRLRVRAADQSDRLAGAGERQRQAARACRAPARIRRRSAGTNHTASLCSGERAARSTPTSASTNAASGGTPQARQDAFRRLPDQRAERRQRPPENRSSRWRASPAPDGKRMPRAHHRNGSGSLTDLLETAARPFAPDRPGGPSRNSIVARFQALEQLRVGTGRNAHRHRGHCARTLRKPAASTPPRPSAGRRSPASPGTSPFRARQQIDALAQRADAGARVRHEERPSRVGTAPWRPRSNSLTPRIDSSSAIVFDTAGCVIDRLSAARWTLPNCARPESTGDAGI